MAVWLGEAVGVFCDDFAVARRAVSGEALAPAAEALSGEFADSCAEFVIASEAVFERLAELLDAVLAGVVVKRERVAEPPAVTRFDVLHVAATASAADVDVSVVLLAVTDTRFRRGVRFHTSV